MTAHGKIHNQKKYVDTVIALYIQLPDTPLKPSYNDRLTASGFFAQKIPVNTIEAALMLASLRRRARQHDQPPLAPVRSLAYFVPAVQEVAASTLPEEYIQYLRLKIRNFSAR